MGSASASQAEDIKTVIDRARGTGVHAGPSTRPAGMRVAVTGPGRALRDRIGTTLSARASNGSIRTIPVSGRDAPILDDVDVAVMACPCPFRLDSGTLNEARELARHTLVVAVLDEHDRRFVRRLLTAGVVGVVFERDLEDALTITVQAVRTGQLVVPLAARTRFEWPALTHRERQVLRFVAIGSTNAQIAAELFLCESTVKSHLTSAFAKLDVASRSEAAALLLDSEEGRRAQLLGEVGLPTPVSAG